MAIWSGKVHQRSLPALGLCLLLLGGACKRPETALRERPAQRIELIQHVAGMTPAEEQALVAQISEGFGIAPEASGQKEGALRVLRITLKGGPDPTIGQGLGKTWLLSTAAGSLVGVLLTGMYAPQFLTVKSSAIAAGAGGLLGFAFGPTLFQNKEALLKELGYLPFRFTADWEVLEVGPGFTERSLTSYPPGLFPSRSGPPILDLKPHLRPLPPEARGEADVRQASLQAYGQALIRHFREKG